MRLVVAILCAAAISIAQAPVAADGVWDDFVQWLRKQPPNSRPGELIRSYRGELRKRGVPDDEAGRRMGMVSDAIFTRRKGVEVLWDKVYAGDKPIFLQTPNAAVISAIEGRKPGKALDIGMGQGRNSVYLAMRGWEVTGFDPSAEGIRIARGNAEKAGVKIEAVVARDDEFAYGEDRWDLIVMTYVRDLTEEDARVYWKALRPGGAVVYENGADQGNSVLKAFLGWQIVRFQDVEATSDWNPENKGRVQRLIAKKNAR